MYVYNAICTVCAVYLHSERIAYTFDLHRVLYTHCMCTMCAMHVQCIGTAYTSCICTAHVLSTPCIWVLHLFYQRGVSYVLNISRPLQHWVLSRGPAVCNTFLMWVETNVTAKHTNATMVQHLELCGTVHSPPQWCICTRVYKNRYSLSIPIHGFSAPESMPQRMAPDVYTQKYINSYRSQT